ncbi:hypothetical protein ON010_g6833 [Phytophthora cinnamomi]|nr:hypothetical protein ON010_g6833 [Phytophthora cinnamomi]
MRCRPDLANWIQSGERGSKPGWIWIWGSGDLRIWGSGGSGTQIGHNHKSESNLPGSAQVVYSRRGNTYWPRSTYAVDIGFGSTRTPRLPSASKRPSPPKESNLPWTTQVPSPSPGIGIDIGPPRSGKTLNYPDPAIGSGKYDKGRPTKSQQGPTTHHKATTRPDPDPGRQIQVGNHLIWTKNREQSEDFRAAPPDPRVSPRRSYFNTWTLQKLPEEQDPALPTGTQGEEFSTDHGSSEYPLR